MSVDATTVRRIAHLARIAVADAEVESLKDELNAMLAFVEQLSEVDVAGVEPMTSVTPMAMKMRADEVKEFGRQEIGHVGAEMPGGVGHDRVETAARVQAQPAPGESEVSRAAAVAGVAIRTASWSLIDQEPAMTVRRPSASG